MQLAPSDAVDALEARERRRLGFGFWLALTWVVLVIGLAVFAPFLPLADPDKILHGQPGEGLLSGRNWLGTDDAGRDLLSRTIWGSRVSLLIAFASVAIGFVIGGLTGMIAGYRRGWLERIVVGAYDVMLAFPAIVLALLLLTFLGRELGIVLVVIGVLSIAPIGRLARANTVTIASREFVVAARGLGATTARMIRREILPNVVFALAGLALLGSAIAIIAEGGLAYLGLSVKDPTLTWGKLISSGSSGTILRDYPLAAFVPIMHLLLTVFSVNFIGDRLRRHFQVREGLSVA